MVRSQGTLFQEGGIIRVTGRFEVFAERSEGNPRPTWYSVVAISRAEAEELVLRQPGVTYARATKVDGQYL